MAAKSPSDTPIRLAKATRGPELTACPVTIMVVGPGIRMTTVAAAAKASQSWKEIMALLPLCLLRASKDRTPAPPQSRFREPAHRFVNAVLEPAARGNFG